MSKERAIIEVVAVEKVSSGEVEIKTFIKKGDKTNERAELFLSKDDAERVIQRRQRLNKLLNGIMPLVMGATFASGLMRLGEGIATKDSTQIGLGVGLLSTSILSCTYNFSPRVLRGRDILKRSLQLETISKLKKIEKAPFN